MNHLRSELYRMSPAELREVLVPLQDLIAKGWIRPSKSPYGAPILFLRKKDGMPCVCA
jgi:hypothetical protein